MTTKQTKTHQILSSKYYLSSDCISLFNNALSTVKHRIGHTKDCFIMLKLHDEGGVELNARV